MIEDDLGRAPDAHLAERTRHHARTKPDAEAFTFFEDERPRTWTFAELDRQVDAVASELAGLPDGARALLLFPSGLEFIAAFLGCLRAGVLAVPAYPPDAARLARSLGRLGVIAQDCAPSVLLTSAAFDALADQIPDLPDSLCALPRVAVDRLTHRGPVATRVAPGDAAFLQYTSGSTSDPKGVIVTHRNLAHHLDSFRERHGFGPDTTFGSWLPMYHDMGLIGKLLPVPWFGARATLMAPEEFLRHPVRWLRMISRCRVEVSGGPDFAYGLCAARVRDEDRAGLDLSSWRMAVNGAEPVRARTLRRFLDAFVPCGFDARAFHPCYGLAEATLQVSGNPPRTPPRWFSVDGDALARGEVRPGERELVGCGTPMPGVEVSILDASGQTLAEDRLGEIALAGPSVTSGYHGRPPEARPLRTGDVGFLHEGELFVVGRTKDMLIVRGQNHFPPDIERAVEGCHPAIRPGGVAAFGGEEDGDLVVLAEVREDGDAVVRAIREAVAAETNLSVREVGLLPPGTLEKTSSGKLQRAACRSSWIAGRYPALRRDRVQPATTPDAREEPTPLLRFILDRVRAAGGLADADASFAANGLDSLKLTELVAALEARVGRALPLGIAFAHPTPARLAHALGEAPAAGESVSRSASSEPLAVLGMALRVPGADDADALWKLLAAGGDAVTSREPSPAPCGYLGPVPFAPSFFRISPEEAQAMDPQQKLLLVLVWEALADAGIDPRLLAGREVGVFVGISTSDHARAALTQASAYAPTGASLSIAANRVSYLLDLRGPSMAVDTACSSSLVALHLAATSLRLGEIELALVAGVNHLGDPRATEALARAGFLADRCRVLDASAAGYARAEGGVVLVLARERRARELGFDARGRVLASAVTQGGRSNALTAPNPAAQAAAIARAWSAAGLSLADARYVELHGTGTALGDPVETEVLASLVPEGTKLTVGALKANVGHLEAAAGLAGVAKVLLCFARAMVPPQVHLVSPNPRVPWSRLRAPRALEAWTPGPAGVSSFGFGGANAHVVLAPAETPPRSRPRPTWEITPTTTTRTDSPHAKLRALVREQLPEEPVEGVSLVRLGLDSMGALSLSAGLLQDFGLRVEPETLLGEIDLRGLLARLGPEATEAVPWLPRLFAALGDGVAVEDSTGAWSGHRLRRAALSIAGALRAAGVWPGERVGLCLDPSCVAAAALLGVAAAGAAWVAVDPAWPASRQAAVWADAGVRKVLAGAVAASFPNIDRMDAQALCDAAPVEPHDGSLDDLAYVLYTSGSTGAPKGVEVTARALATHLQGAAKVLAPSAPRWLSVTTFSFDISILEVLLPLLHGGTVRFLDARLRQDGRALRATVEAWRPGWLQATPSTWRMLLAAGWGGDPALHAVSGGEALDRPLADALRARVGALWNAYGPTEATIWATLGRITGEVHLGEPIPGYRLRVVEGELWIGGDAVARGYHGSPARTAERFRDEFGTRWYRTGDRVERCDDGRLLYRGRLDDQVKVGGQRVEPAEIEAALAALAGVREAAVRALDGRLVAFYSGEATPDALREALGARLPGAMVPRTLVALPSLPRSSSGKIDRAALRLPAAYTVDAAREGGVTGMLEALFEEALGAPCAGDFFAAGGDSLKATRLLVKLRESLGRDVPFHALTEAPTPSALAAWLLRPETSGPDLEPDARLAPALRPRARTSPVSEGALLLTGATGFVGKLLLERLLARVAGPVLCLVRCASLEDGLRRLGLADGPGRVEVIPGDLTAPRLGLGDAEYAALAARTSRVVHNGALVNFVYPYRSLRAANVEGTRAMIEFAADAGAELHHVSSVAVFESQGYADAEEIREDADIDLSVGLYDGYPQSKWVAEKLAREAGRRGLRVSIYRPGMVSGHSQTGASNAGDFIMRMIRGCAELGVAPDLDTLVELVPVDYVADALATLVARGEPGTWHLTNPTPLHAREFIALLGRLGYPMERVPYAEWRAHALAKLPPTNPLFPLLPFFAARADAVSLRLPRFATSETEAALGPLTCPPVGEALLARSLAWLRAEGLLGAARPTP
jgi:amino acid adenylation domain-containing protein/thioester reductase-like protein